MDNTSNKNELDFIRQYETKGFTHSFRVVKGKLIDNETKNSFAPKQIHIVAEHRYEGMSNPDDMSILYVIKTSEGAKGTFLAAYGAIANTESMEFFADIPKENVSNSENIALNG
jgi:hypothetical protein